jgi:hypothetical protein
MVNPDRGTLLFLSDLEAASEVHGKIKRIYDSVSPRDGKRMLIDRS